MYTRIHVDVYLESEELENLIPVSDNPNDKYFYYHEDEDYRHIAKAMRVENAKNIKSWSLKLLDSTNIFNNTLKQIGQLKIKTMEHMYNRANKDNIERSGRNEHEFESKNTIDINLHQDVLIKNPFQKKEKKSIYVSHRKSGANEEQSSERGSITPTVTIKEISKFQNPNSIGENPRNEKLNRVNSLRIKEDGYQNNNQGNKTMQALSLFKKSQSSSSFPDEQEIEKNEDEKLI